MKKFAVFLGGMIIAFSLVGCAKQSEPRQTNDVNTTLITQTTDIVESNESSQVETSNDSIADTPNLEVQFGYEGKAFVLELYDNDTAIEIAKSVGTEDWNLPIYNFDNYENYEVMQFYDIPSSYKIPSDPETVTSQKAGEVYYSHPNRIILFYQDAQVIGEYTRVGKISNIEGLVEAVENNPVVAGWGNKIVSISPVQ